MNRGSLLASLAFIAAGVAVVPLSRWYGSYQADQPVAVGIRVVKGFTSEWSFTPRFTDSYELNVEATYRADLDGDSLVGLTFREATSEDSVARSEIDIAWQLREAGKVTSAGIARGRNTGYVVTGGPPTTGRQLCRLQVAAGHRYVLRVQVQSDGPRLNALSPRLRLERQPFSYEWVPLAYVAALGVAVGLVVIGLIGVWLSLFQRGGTGTG